MKIYFDPQKIAIAAGKKGMQQNEIANNAGLSCNWTCILLERGWGNASTVNKLAQAVGLTIEEVAVGDK